MELSDLDGPPWEGSRHWLAISMGHSSVIDRGVCLLGRQALGQIVTREDETALLFTGRVAYLDVYYKYAMPRA